MQFPMRGKCAMRVASFNVENLFERATALDQPTWSDGRRALELHALVNGLLNKKTLYTSRQERDRQSVDRAGFRQVRRWWEVRRLAPEPRALAQTLERRHRNRRQW